MNVFESFEYIFKLFTFTQALNYLSNIFDLVLNNISLFS